MTAVAEITTVRLEPGDSGEKIMPHSEVCMHMRVAGQKLWFILLDREYPMVQLVKNNQLFSAPITTGEAGIYQDEEGYYYHPELG